MTLADATPSRPVGSRALATIGTGPMGEVLARSLPAMQRFATRHGYDLVVGQGDSGGRPAPWAKITLIQRLLPMYESVLWVDADVLIVKDDADLPELPDGAFQAMVEQQSSGSVANTGVWLLRSCDAARDFLSEVWAQTSRINHRWWEQTAVLDLMGYEGFPDDPGTDGITRHATRTEAYEGTHFLPPEWNSLYLPYLRDVEDPRFWHFAAMDNRARVLAMEVEMRRHDSGLSARYRDLLSARYNARRLVKRR